MSNEMNPMTLWSQNMNALTNNMWEVNKLIFQNIQNFNEQILNGVGKTIDVGVNTQNAGNNNQSNLANDFKGIVEQFIQNKQNQMKSFTSSSEQMMEQMKNNWQQAMGIATEMGSNMFMMPGMSNYIRQIEELSQKISEQSSRWHSYNDEHELRKEHKNAHRNEKHDHKHEQKQAH